jgi:hypothetical protein
MNRSFTLAIFALFGCIGCEMIKPSPGRPITGQQDQPLCGLLIASHRSSLESMFEVELYAVAYDSDDWHIALKSLDVPTSDSSGHPRTSGSILQSAIDRLVQVKNAGDRIRLEYLLLGSRMSLEERRRFDAYCVAGAVDE